MHKKSILGLAVMMVGMCGLTGCPWNDEDYNYFVNEGAISSCEKMKYIIPSGKEYICSPSCDLIGVNNCISLDREECSAYKKAFDYSICPSPLQCHDPGSDNEEDIINDDSIKSDFAYCSICKRGYTECGGTCVNTENDINNCGGCIDSDQSGVKCINGDDKIEDETLTDRYKRVDNSVDVACVNQQCIPLTCKKGYHLSDNHDACVADSVNSCGGIDCTQTGGWKDGKCDIEKVECRAEECVPGYHIYNANIDGKIYPCGIDSTKDCGELGYQCQENNGIKYAFCAVIGAKDTKSSCGIALCDSGFHVNKDMNACEKDSLQKCGSYNNDCTNYFGVTQATDIKCENAECVFVDCDKTRFYLDETTNSCLPNNTLNCGKKGNKCQSGEICSNGVCSESCDNGKEICEGVCVDFTAVETCGDCKNDCRDKIHNAANIKCKWNNTNSCSNEKCCEATSCRANYTLVDGQCKENSSTNCGNVNCNMVLFGKEIVDEDLHVNVYCNQDNSCSYDCKDGYGDCDNQQYNGCETVLSYFGLKGGCSDCQEGYKRCGEYYRNGITVSLCLKEGKSYKNYDVKDSKMFHKSVTYGNVKYYYDYKKFDVETDYDSGAWFSRKYKKNSDHWNETINPWNESTCMKACNQGWGVEYYDSNGNKSYSHSCEPKEECDQFDSVNSYNKYIDYGCSY